MATELPKYKHMKTGEIYYLDLRLGEFRNVKNPHDNMPALAHEPMRRERRREATA